MYRSIISNYEERQKVKLCTHVLLFFKSQYLCMDVIHMYSTGWFM